MAEKLCLQFRPSGELYRDAAGRDTWLSGSSEFSRALGEASRLLDGNDRHTLHMETPESVAEYCAKQLRAATAWEVASALAGSGGLSILLAQGWEPFAATPAAEGILIHLRRITQAQMPAPHVYDPQTQTVEPQASATGPGYSGFTDLPDGRRLLHGRDGSLRIYVPPAPRDE